MRRGGRVMSASPLATMLGRFQRLVSAVKAEDLPDAELLKRFTQDRDQEALAALVWRHGPLVWRVCKRVLRNSDGAEDVFQATFLILARNAKSIRKPAALASWLHGVAFRTAREWQSRRGRRGSKGQVVA